MSRAKSVWESAAESDREPLPPNDSQQIMALLVQEKKLNLNSIFYKFRATATASTADDGNALLTLVQGLDWAELDSSDNWEKFGLSVRLDREAVDEEKDLWHTY